VKLIKLLFLVFALNSAVLFAETFTFADSGSMQLGDADPTLLGPCCVACHDGDTVILHKGCSLTIQASTNLSPNTPPSKSFSFYFDTHEYLIENPIRYASDDSGIYDNFFFSRINVLAKDLGPTKLHFDTITGDGNHLEVKKETITIIVDPATEPTA